MGLKCSHKCPCKREVEGNLRREEKAVWPRKQRLKWSGHKPRKVVLPEAGAARSCKRQGRVCPRASGGSMAPSALGLWLSDTGLRRLTSRNVRGETTVILNHQVCGAAKAVLEHNTKQHGLMRWWEPLPWRGPHLTLEDAPSGISTLVCLRMDFALKNGQTTISSHWGWCLLICTSWWCGKKRDWNSLFVQFLDYYFLSL